MTRTVQYGDFVVLDDPWIRSDLSIWKIKVYQSLGYKIRGFIYYPKIIVIKGGLEPTKKEIDALFGKPAIQWPYIHVGIEWLTENLSPEEFADYAAERLRGT